MDSKELIINIKDFFDTANESALAEVNAAFSVEIPNDISIEEYLGGFSNAQLSERHVDKSMRDAIS